VPSIWILWWQPLKSWRNTRLSIKYYILFRHILLPTS